MQKIKIGHRAKFRARNKYFLQVSFPVRPIISSFYYLALGRTVTPVFVLMDHFLYQFSAFREKIKKIYRLEV